ncbi:hypothetical protein JX266_004687 [Neoarthrinium moseri]|nr:hypothetical protein JX266_004687 [Neoarthrinium moseri]
MSGNLLEGLPSGAPRAASRKLRYADVAVTATAKEFAGIYRGKKQHESDIPAMLDRALVAGCEKIMLTGMSLHDVDFNLEIAKSHPGQCFITVGCHPYHAKEVEGEDGYLDKLSTRIQELLAMQPCPLAAFGELGLDYDHLDYASKEVQQRAFRLQLDLAVKVNLPLFLHCRSAFADFRDILAPYMPRLQRKGLVHSFVGSEAEMIALIDLGLHISVNGFTFKTNESLRMVASIPLGCLHIETDAPWGIIQPSSDVAKRYLVHAPEAPSSKKRDKFEMGYMVKDRFESCLIERVALIVAGLKGLTVDEVADNAWRNSTSMFRLDKESD